MSIAWINAIALAGLGLVVLPLAIHLFVRQQVRVVAYPSLRFLRQTQLAAFRRRRIQDAALLACRFAIIAAAAVALAGPVLQTRARTAAHAGRTSRAIVIVGDAPGALRQTLEAGTFAAATFRRAAVGDAVLDAVRWLEARPASSREIVIAGELRLGSVNATDLAGVPGDVGIRLVQTAAPAPVEIDWPLLSIRGDTLVRISRRVRLEAGRTIVTDAPGVAAPNARVLIAAADADQRLADAALRVALEVGVPWSDFERPVLVVWTGADEAKVKAASGSTHVIRMPRPSGVATAADETAASLMRAAGRPPAAIEPVLITPEQLREWSRQPGPPARDAPPADEGDRRWFWGLALALLALEWWLRRPPSRSERFGGQPSPGLPTEAHTNVSKRERRLEARVA
jgi:hypothetical protein